MITNQPEEFELGEDCTAVGEGETKIFACPALSKRSKPAILSL